MEIAFQGDGDRRAKSEVKEGKTSVKNRKGTFRVFAD